MKRPLLSTAALPALLVMGTVAAHAQEPAAPQPQPSPPAKAPEPTTPPAAKAPEPPSTPSPPTAGEKSTTITFPSQQTADQRRSSRLVGQPVYTEAGERIGDIKELIVSNDGQIDAVVIGVGGFLGLGEKLVAVTYKDLKVTEEANGSMRIALHSTKEALETAPEYKYSQDKRS